MSSEISTRIIDRVAMLVKQMTPPQLERLLDLAPDLRREVLARVRTQADLADYFERRVAEVISREAAHLSVPEEEIDTPFLGPYTLGEFCALPEDEQVRLWDRAHAEVWKKLSDVEYPVRSDAMSAR